MSEVGFGLVCLNTDAGHRLNRLIRVVATHARRVVVLLRASQRARKRKEEEEEEDAAKVLRVRFLPNST